MKRTLLFVVNVDRFFLSHRFPIAQEAVRQGYDVHIATEVTDGLEIMRASGLTVHPIRVRREDRSWWDSIRFFVDLYKIFKDVQADIVHLVTIRPVLLGGILARVMGVPHVVAAISGLGTVFTSRGPWASLRRVLVQNLYKIALGSKNTCVIFQNEEDRKILSSVARLRSDQMILIRGSGADLDTFHLSPLPKGPTVVLMSSRLLVEKGVWEFVEAARILKQRGATYRFWLSGEIDPANPGSLTEADLQRLRADGAVDVLGYCSDMAEKIAQAHIVVLPSYYGEGVPKALIEAAASARAIITTDRPGCRDVVIPDVSGLLVPPKDAAALAEAISVLASDRVRCEAMGAEGRRLAEKEFDLQAVIARHLELYSQLNERFHTKA